MNATPGALPDATPAETWTWKDHSRFVQVAPVQRGWLVLWGRYQGHSGARMLEGERTYTDLAGARRRVADAVFELTRDLALVAEALVQFDRARFPRHVVPAAIDSL
jgi:hypothetical protein